MKKLIVLLLLIPSLLYAEEWREEINLSTEWTESILPTQEMARANLAIVGGGVTAVGGACTATYCNPANCTSAPTLAAYVIAAQATDHIWAGQKSFVLGSDSSICRIDFYIQLAVGTLTKNYVAEIYSMTANALNVLQGSASATCTGVASATWAACSFSSDVSLAAGTYSFTLTASDHTYDADNYPAMVSTTDGVISGSDAWWDLNKNYVDSAAGDLGIRIFVR